MRERQQSAFSTAMAERSWRWQIWDLLLGKSSSPEKQL
jgi:hypothetical protein